MNSQEKLTYLIIIGIMTGVITIFANMIGDLKIKVKTQDAIIETLRQDIKIQEGTIETYKLVSGIKENHKTKR